VKARARWAAARTLQLAIPLAVLIASGSAAAQTQEADAERLFREGQKLMEERRFGEACPKFEAAYNKDHSLGTLINLAFCHKEQGALWYAWLEFREAEVKATELNRPDRRDFAKQRLAELEKQLPKVVIDNPQKVPLTDVLVEDRKVFEAERGAVFAAEAGQRRFIFKAKGKKPGAALINVANVTKGDKVQHVSVPEMEDAVEEPPKADGAMGDPAKDGPATADADPGAKQRTIGWIAASAGGVALLIGTIEGVVTFSSPCQGGKDCTDDERSSAKTTGLVSTVAFTLGVIGVVGGVVLLLNAPDGHAASSPVTQARPRTSPVPRASAVTVVPQLGLGWAGLSGRF
jgi:hypothetical protein